MATAFLTRRVTFAAAHRYRRPEWDDARNEATFGLCARPSFHGHSYLCDVTVTGPIDPVTGMIVDLGVLDRILATEVRERFDHRPLEQLRIAQHLADVAHRAGRHACRGQRLDPLAA